MCRKPILDEAADEWRQFLKDWHPAWDANVSDAPVHPTDFAEHGQQLFMDLCEAIVCWIEDPSVDDAENWLCCREPFRQIISFQTFDRFAAVVTGEPSYLQRLAKDLPTYLPDAQVFERLMIHVDGIPGYELVTGEGLMMADEDTFKKLEGFYRRITKSHDVLYSRLYRGFPNH
ncbi:MAG: hypothetical protein Q9181_007185 [Wetmoreana brouardii]